MPAPMARSGRRPLARRARDSRWSPAAPSMLQTSGSVLVVPEVEVVDDEDIDRIHAEPLQAVLIGAHDAVIAVVQAISNCSPPAQHAAVEALRD